MSIFTTTGMTQHNTQHRHIFPTLKTRSIEFIGALKMAKNICFKEIILVIISLYLYQELKKQNILHLGINIYKSLKQVII